MVQRTSVIPLEVYYLEGSGWDSKVISEKIHHANQIMNNCGLRIDLVKGINKLTFDHADGSIELMGEGSDEPLSRRENEIRLHQQVNAELGDQRLRMFFVGRVPNLISIFGTSRRVETHPGEIYLNSTYITNQQGIDGADLTIAHELGHVLLNEGHYHLDPTPNIMHYMFTHQIREFNTNQCQKMKDSLLIIPSPTIF